MIGPEFHGGGHPWHGLCTDGTLSLPNADTMAYPQPSGGDCFKLAVPGFTATERTAAQLAADEAAGHEWLPYALVSGDSSTETGLQVYGYPLGQMCWIWAVSPTEKWRVDASALAVAAGTLSGALTLTEFGMHWPDGRAAETRTVEVSGSAGTDSAVRMKVLDVSEDGGRALLGLYPHLESEHEGAAMRPLPASTVEITLDSGDYSAAVAVVHDDVDTNTMLGDQRSIGAVVSGAGSETFHVVLGTDGLWARQYLLRASAELCYIDIRAVPTITSTTPADTVEYIAPTASTVHLAGSAACPSGGSAVSYDFIEDTLTLADIESAINSALASRQAEIEAQYADLYRTCPDGVPTTLLLADYVVEGTQPYANYSWAVQFVEELVTVGSQTYKWAYYRVNETKTAYEFVTENDGECFASVTEGSTVTLPVASSDYVYYFRKSTTGATGQIDWHYWATQPTCASPQYLYAPDLYTPGSAAVYTWDVDSEILARIDGNTFSLGTQSFVFKASTQSLSTLSFSREFINDPDTGNADRVVFRYTHPSPPNDTAYQATACEVVFANPCAGLYGFALVNYLGATEQPNYLYQLARRDGSLQAWAGWSAYGPHEYNYSLHPVSLAVSGTAPTENEVPELPANPAAAVCYV